MEAWLEESYSSNVPTNYRCHIYNIVDRFYNALIIPIFTLFLFQDLFIILFLERVCRLGITRMATLALWIYTAYFSAIVA